MATVSAENLDFTQTSRELATCGELLEKLSSTCCMPVPAV